MEKNSLRAVGKISEVYSFYYPVMIGSIGDKQVVMDLGAHGEFEVLSYLDYEDKSRVQNILSKVDEINKVFRRNVITPSTTKELENKLEEIGKKEELIRKKALEGIFIDDVKLAKEDLERYIREERITTNMISMNQDEINELEKILSKTERGNVEQNTLMGIDPSDAINMAKELFELGEEIITEKEKSDENVAMEILDFISGYSHLMEHMGELLRATLSHDPITFKQSIFIAFCPACSAELMKDVKEEIDILRWTDMKILGGNILEDPDLTNPEPIARKEVEEIRERLLRTLKSKLPIPKENETSFSLSRGPILIVEGDYWVCPRCGAKYTFEDLKREGAIVPRVFIPLARGYATLFHLSKESMINKATPIIRNIHESKTTKDQRITQLAGLRSEVERLEKEKLEIEHKIDACKKLLSEINRLR